MNHILFFLYAKYLLLYLIIIDYDVVHSIHYNP